MVKKRKLKKGPKIILLILLLLIAIILFANHKYQEYLYKQTFEYKLLEKEYTKEEVNTILNKLTEEQISTIIEKEKNSYFIDLLNEKYFLFKNLDRYLALHNNSLTRSPKEIVSLVNVNRDRNYYENPIATNLSDNNLILVNKYYYLSEDYTPENLQNISYQYAYADQLATTETIEAFKNMYTDALKEDIQLIVNSSYRSYNEQDEIWATRKKLYGIKKADSYAARAGHSEHQTGLVLDIDQYNFKGEEFTDAPAYTWLANNAHKYGFILRYPENKEEITGYSYESWHYRYVGIEVAKIIHDEDITFDEYYAYYIEK